MKRYEVIESKCWLHYSGAKASIYGACPWWNEEERKEWIMHVSGYTIMDTKTGTVGIGRAPFLTKEEAQAFIDKF